MKNKNFLPYRFITSGKSVTIVKNLSQGNNLFRNSLLTEDKNILLHAVVM